MFRTVIVALIVTATLQACDSGGSSSPDVFQDPDNIASGFGGVDINLNGLSGRALSEAPPASSADTNRPMVFSDPGLVSAIPGQVESVEIGFNINSSLVSVFISTEGLDQHIAFDLPPESANESQQIVRMQIQVPNADETFCYSVKALDFQQLVSDPTMLCLIGTDQSASETARIVYFADFANNSTLSTLSVDTGEVREIGRTGIQLTDVAILNGTLYGVTDSSLYTVDPITGESGFVGRMGASFVNALVGFDNNLYAANSTGQLLQVNPTTGAADVIGDLAGGTSSGDLVPTDDSTGLLGTINVSGSQSDWLMRHDLETGTSELVGETGFQQVWGLAFFRSQLIGLTNDGELILIDPNTGAGALVDQTRALSAGGAAVDTELSLGSVPSVGGIDFATFSTLKAPVEGDGWRMVAGSDQHDAVYSIDGLDVEIDDTFAFDLNKTAGENTNADKGALVTAVFDGQVFFRHEPLGFVLVEHTTPLLLASGEEITPWYSGYMHMDQIPDELTNVNVNTKLGVVGDVGVEGVDHLHFSLYRSDNGVFRSIDIANELGDYTSFISEWSDQCGETAIDTQVMAWWAIGSSPCL